MSGRELRSAGLLSTGNEQTSTLEKLTAGAIHRNKRKALSSAKVMKRPYRSVFWDMVAIGASTSFMEVSKHRSEYIQWSKILVGTTVH
jgi:hypothetical protein